MLKVKKDLNNLIIGPLKVIEKSKIKDKKNCWWKCQCLICNSVKNYRSQEIYNTRRSCGCLGNPSGNKAHDFKGFGEVSKSYFNKIKDTAKRKNIKFDITIEEIWDLFLKQNRKCILSGQDINFGKSYRSRTKTASLDRIDCSKGYIKDNIQWVHKDVNYIKYTNSDKELFNICKKIYQFRNNIKNYNYNLIENQISHLPVSLFERFKKLSQKRNIEWNLSYNDANNVYLKQNKQCSLSGEFIYFTQPYIQKTNGSLDRIDSSNRYTLDNIQWITKNCNLMKNKYSNEYFIETCIKIYFHLKDKYDSN